MRNENIRLLMDVTMNASNVSLNNEKRYEREKALIRAISEGRASKIILLRQKKIYTYV